MSASREKKMRKEQSAEAYDSKSKQGMSRGLKTFITVVCIVLVVAIVAFFTMLTTGFFASHMTAAVVEGHKLTPAMVNYYYNQSVSSMSSYLSYFGVDTSVSLDEQVYDETTGETWADYFMEQAIQTAAATYTVYDDAVANGYELSAKDASAIDGQIEMLGFYASSSSLSVDGYLASVYGTGCNEANYREYLTVTETASYYANEVQESYTYTADQIADEYAANPQDYDSVSYRLFSVTGSMFDEEDEDKLAELEEDMASEMAQISEGDEQAFIDAAAENYVTSSEDETYDADSSTLNEDVSYDSCISGTADWLFDDARSEGDTTYIESNGTYYVLYFLSRDTHDYELPNARHILISVSDTSDEDAMAEAKEKADSILDEYLAGDQTEEAFEALADEYNEDSSSLYENIEPGEMTTGFNDWVFDATRQTGDTAVIETEYGYHVMYFCGYGDIYRDVLVEDALRSADYTAWYDALVADVTTSTNSLGMRFVNK